VFAAKLKNGARERRFLWVFDNLLRSDKPPPQDSAGFKVDRDAHAPRDTATIR
jgi:hypothetical protein